MDDHETVRREFSKQAVHFGEAGLTLSNTEYLKWIVGVLRPRPRWRALDVAAGTGHLTRALAPHVEHVTAVDITPAMLERGRREAEAAGLGNVAFEEGAAERLPYADGAFDLVATRFSLHHMVDPAPALAEMARVCREGGILAVIDLVSPADRRLADRYNHYERLRDPSHTRALTFRALQRAVTGAGVVVQEALVRDVEVVTERWLEMTHTPPDTRRAIVEALEAELARGELTGLRPFRRDGRVGFLHAWAVVTGQR